jgi:hypothetical protein
LFYRQLIAAMAENPLDLTGIYRRLSVHEAGYLSDCIEELIEAGFLGKANEQISQGMRCIWPA